MEDLSWRSGHLLMSKILSYFQVSTKYIVIKSENDFDIGANASAEEAEVYDLVNLLEKSCSQFRRSWSKQKIK